MSSSIARFPNIRWGAAFIILSFVLAACGSSRESGTNGSRSGDSAQRIVFSELESPVGGMTAYQVVNKYKPHWLRKRGRSSLENPVPIKVYLNDSESPFGTVSDLRQLEAANISIIERLTSREAQFEYGIEHFSGALVVRTKSGGK